LTLAVQNVLFQNICQAISLDMICINAKWIRKHSERLLVLLFCRSLPWRFGGKTAMLNCYAEWCLLWTLV